jgi:H+-transporting ATPase
MKFIVLLVDGVPIPMPTILSLTLAIDAQQGAKHKAFVTRVSLQVAHIQLD